MKSLLLAMICVGVLSSAVLAVEQAQGTGTPTEKNASDPGQAPSEQKQLDLDLERFQGLWESKDYGSSSPASGIARATRRIEGKKNTVTFFNKDGDVIHEHWSDLELAPAGAVRLYLYKIREVTAGPQKGHSAPAGPISSYSSYVYKFEGNDKHHEIVGVIANDPRPPAIVVWTRLNDK